MPHDENLMISSYDELLAQAKQGDRQALGQLLEEHRAYLKVLSERQLDRRLEARIDASDLIQQTCLSVFASFVQFAGQSEGEFAAWIQTVHEYTIQNAIRDSVAKEVGLEIGDEIVSVNRRRIASLADLRRELLIASEKESAVITVVRGGSRKDFTVHLAGRQNRGGRF